MTNLNPPADPNAGAAPLARIAEALSLEIDEEDLAALGKQIGVIAALEASELQDVPPVLTMDAAWHE
jgi:hypothetical protein